MIHIALWLASALFIGWLVLRGFVMVLTFAAWLIDWSNDHLNKRKKTR